MKNADAEKALDLKAETLSLHAQNLQLREENAQFRGQISQLQEEIRREQESSTERKKHQEKKIGRSVVLIHEDDPNTYYCSNCFKTKREAFPLQTMAHVFHFAGTHQCGVCQAKFGAR